ncbi:uncharacterized protein LOC126368637 [Pectinophora gossypiella]|uniref:uncharacterized protein LOC126368637 n=1 Tax=Pectinophora gossypiella TaxID=13191 RepID=UPI00214EB2FE|nr:uncharacterized protein LOC126368637 [Pectinophora gossypiella]
MADVVTDEKPAYFISERDFISLLIELYKNHPELWKHSHPHYTDRHKRSCALQEITTALRPYKPEIDEDYLKRKINIFRSNYRRARHKVALARRQGIKDVQLTPWYYNELLFLSEQGEQKRTNVLKQRTNIGTRKSTDVEYDENEDVECYAEQTENDTIPEESFDPLEPTSSTPPKSNNQTKVTVEKRKIEIPEEEEDSEPEKYMTITTTYYKKPKPKEDLIAKPWAIKLNKLPALQRLHAERLINEVFYEAEMGNLSKDTQIGVVLPQ